MDNNLQSYISLPNYPGYFLNKFGNICYLKDDSYISCKIVKPKTGLTEIYVKRFNFQKKLIGYEKKLVSFFQLADKYYPDWLQTRSNTTILNYLNYCKRLKLHPNKLANNKRSQHLSKVRALKSNKRQLDGRYKSGVDTGNMSKHKVYPEVSWTI
jgi:hypothetical protein